MIIIIVDHYEFLSFIIYIYILNLILQYTVKNILLWSYYYYCYTCLYLYVTAFLPACAFVHVPPRTPFHLPVYRYIHHQTTYPSIYLSTYVISPCSLPFWTSFLSPHESFLIRLMYILPYRSLCLYVCLSIRSPSCVSKQPVLVPVLFSYSPPPPSSVNTRCIDGSSNASPLLALSIKIQRSL